MKVGSRSCQPDDHVARPASDVDRGAEGLREIAVQAVDEELIRRAEVRPRIRDRLPLILHELGFEHAIHGSLYFPTRCGTSFSFSRHAYSSRSVSSAMR